MYERRIKIILSLFWYLRLVNGTDGSGFVHCECSALKKVENAVKGCSDTSFHATYTCQFEDKAIDVACQNGTWKEFELSCTSSGGPTPVPTVKTEPPVPNEAQKYSEDNKASPGKVTAIVVAVIAVVVALVVIAAVYVIRRRKLRADESAGIYVTKNSEEQHTIADGITNKAYDDWNIPTGQRIGRNLYDNSFTEQKAFDNDAYFNGSGTPKPGREAFNSVTYSKSLNTTYDKAPVESPRDSGFVETDMHKAGTADTFNEPGVDSFYHTTNREPKPRPSVPDHRYDHLDRSENRDKRSEDIDDYDNTTIQ